MSLTNLLGSHSVDQSLPDTLPDDPFPTFKGWFDEAHARKIQRNPNSMSLATVDADGSPSVRIVLCKEIDLGRGFVTFFTNYHGRKGRALSARPRAAVCFHWDELERQVRIEGPVTRVPEAESDAYFATRALERQLGAWASDQSEPIESHEKLMEKAMIVMARLCSEAGPKIDDIPVIPRPPHWGGYRIWAERVELWVNGLGRLHDRAEWRRDLRPATADGVPGYEAASAWRKTRLQP